MSSEKETQKPTKSKKRTFKVVKWLLVGVLGVILLLFFGVPLFLSSSSGTHFLVDKINSSVDGNVQMDDFSIGWFKGVKLTNLSYADSTGKTSISIDSVETQPKYMSLLAGKVKLGKTVIQKPQVYLRVPKFDDEKVSVTGKAPSSKNEPATSAPVFPINQMDLELIDGMAKIDLIGDVPQKVSFTNIASKVQIAEAGKPSSIDVSMNVDDTSTILAKGTATPAKEGWVLKEGDFEVHVSKLQLASLKPLFALAGQPMDMTGELNADAAVQVKGNQIQQLKAGAVVNDFTQGTGEQRMVFEKPIIISALAGQQGDTVTIDNLKIESEFCNAACTGTLEAVDYTIDADLAQTQRLIGQFTDMGGLSMQGSLMASGNVSMTDQAVKASGIGSIAKLVVKKGSVSTPMTDAQMNFDCMVDQVKKQLRLASANLTATLGSVKIANLVMPMGDQGDKTISLDAQVNLDLAKTWAYAQVFAEVPEGLELAGMLDSAVKISTEANAVRLLTDKTQINQFKMLQKDNEPFEREQITLKGEAIWTEEADRETIHIPKIDLLDENGKSLFKGINVKYEKRKSQANTEIKANLKAEYDLKALSTLASAYLPQGLVLEGRRSDFLHFESQYPTDKPDLMLANLNANGAVGFDKAQFQGLNFGPTEVKVNVKQGQAAIDIPDADVNGGKVRFAGNINLAEKPMMLRLRQSTQSTQVVENVKIDDVISATLLQYLNPVFAKGTGVTGTANLSCSMLEIPLGGGTPEDINLDGSVGLTDVHLNSPLLRLFGEALRTEGLDLFSIPPSPFMVKDGFVRYEDMPMIFGDDFSLHFGGSVGLDKSLAMNVQVPLDGRNVEVPLGGTLTKPKLDLGKLMLSNITNEIPIKDEKTKEAVEKGLQLLEGILNEK